MNYEGKEVAITGWRGFIGSRLAKELESYGANVNLIYGDVRNSNTFNTIDHSYDYLFHFGAPSSQVLFSRQPQYCHDVTLKGFMNALGACQENGVKLVYPSTGLLSQGQENEYARCKKVCESMAAGTDALGIRIFATYGPGEGHKRDYASVPYLFARDMVAGKIPVVFGDGKQSRDFIYIDDVVAGILELAESCNDPVVNLGSGIPISFNSLIGYITDALGIKAGVKTNRLHPPKGYVDSTKATDLVYTPQVGIETGISKLVKHLQEKD